MDGLIEKVSSTLGLDEIVVKRAIGGILEFLKDNVGEDFDFNKIVGKLQGADTLIENADKPLPETAERAEGTAASPGGSSTIIQLITWILSAGPVLDILKKILSIFFGESAVQMIDSAGDGAELVGKLNKLGLSTEQGKQMVSMLISFMKSKVGDETIDELTDKIPALKAVLDTAKKDE